MLMPPFELHHPTTVAEAVELAASLMEQNEAFDWVAGGTDVLPNYKWRINPKPHVISSQASKRLTTSLPVKSVAWSRCPH